MRSETDHLRLDLDQSPRSGMDESKLEFAEDISNSEKRHSSHRGRDSGEVTSGHSMLESSENRNGFSCFSEHQLQGIFERNVQSTMPALSSAAPCNNTDGTPCYNTDNSLNKHGKSVYLDNHKDNNFIEKNNNKSDPRNNCFISEPSDSHLNCTRANDKPAMPVQISSCAHSKTGEVFQKQNGYSDFSSTENFNTSNDFNENGSNSTCIKSSENRDKYSKSLYSESQATPGISVPSLGSSPSTSPPPNHTSSSDYTTASITNSASSLSDGRQERASSEGLSEAEFPHFDNVVMETDGNVRRISFTLSLGSDGSSSGQDSQDHPTQPIKSVTSKPGNRSDDTDDAIVEVPEDVTKPEPSHKTMTDNELYDSTTRTRRSRKAGGEIQGDARATLTMRISKSLSNFFQKHPQRQSPMSDTGELIQARDECPKASSKGSFKSKAPKRSNSLAGRVMSSLARLGRKGTVKTSTDEMDDEEEIFNNNRNTPVFVMPEDQVDVVDKAPTPLTEDQGKILRETWALIKNDVAEVGVETFMGLFHTHPDAIDSFLAFKDKSVQDLERSAVLKAHALRVMQTVDKCITRLDRVDRMVTLLHQLGKRHVGYHANIRLIPIIGKQFISAIEPKIAKKWSSETRAAWECLFTIINYNIRRGLMEEKNRRIEEAKEMEMLLKRSEARSKRDKK